MMTIGQQPQNSLDGTTGDRSAEIVELIARLQKATGPDRRLDFDIWSVADPDGISQRAWTPHELKLPWDQWFESWKAHSTAFARYTESIDAAMTLIPERWAENIWLKRHGGHHWSCELHIPSSQYGGHHVEAPIAVCIAALYALTTTSILRSPDMSRRK